MKLCDINLQMIGGREMANYKKMYAVLCCAIDDVIGSLSQIPLAQESVRHLQHALLQTENIYIETSTYLQDCGQRVVELKVDCPDDDEDGESGLFPFLPSPPQGRSDSGDHTKMNETP